MVRRTSFSLSGLRRMFDKTLPEETIKAFAELAEQILTNEGGPLRDEGIVLPGPITDIIRSAFNMQEGALGNEIGRCFGLDETGALIRKGNRYGARIAFRRRFADDSAPAEHKLMVRAQATEFRTTIPEGTQIRIDVGDADELSAYLRHMAEIVSVANRRKEPRDAQIWQQAWWIVESLVDYVRPQIMGPLHLPAFYLPADRTGVMHAHSVVVSALIGSASMAGLRPAVRTPMLSGVLADFLEQLIELDRPPHRRRTPRHDLGTRIEEAILDGSVRVDRSGAIDYPRFTYRPRGWEDSLPLMNASSMVSELAPVVLYLRHMVESSNVLIVEEPESHLHPAMQVEFTRQLATLVHSGIRVIVTTHSEWVLEELANIVRRSALPKKEDSGDGKIALRPEQVGAWLFKQKERRKGSVVEEVKLDDETGLYPTDYDAVSEALYNDSANIFNRTQGGDA